MSTGEAQTIILIDDGDGIPLSREHDVGELKTRIEKAVAEHRFVDLRTTDGGEVSVLLSPHSRVRIAVLPLHREVLEPVTAVGFDGLPADLL